MDFSLIGETRDTFENGVNYMGRVGAVGIGCLRQGGAAFCGVVIALSRPFGQRFRLLLLRSLCLALLSAVAFAAVSFLHF